MDKRTNKQIEKDFTSYQSYREWLQAHPYDDDSTPPPDGVYGDLTPAEIAEYEAKQDDKPSRFTTPALQAVNDLLLTLTIVAENSDEWKRFQYSGESKDVIIDRVDGHIMFHLDAAQDEIERLQAENARLREALDVASHALHVIAMDYGLNDPQTPIAVSTLDKIDVILGGKDSEAQ